MPVADSKSGAGESAVTVTRLLDKPEAGADLRDGRLTLTRTRASQLPRLATGGPP